MISTGALHIDVMSEEGISYYIEGAIEISTWLLHFIYVMTLVERLTPSIRGEFDLWPIEVWNTVWVGVSPKLHVMEI